MTTGPASAEDDCVPGWSKCGGHGWKGATCCASGYACVEQNVWHSICIPTPANLLAPKKPDRGADDDESGGARIAPETEAPTAAPQTTKPPLDLILRQAAPSTTAIAHRPVEVTTTLQIVNPAYHSHVDVVAASSSAGFSIAWWAWVLLATQTIAVLALGFFLWRLHSKTESSPPDARRTASSSRALCTPKRSTRGGLAGVFSFQGLPNLSPLAPHSPGAASSARSFKATSPTRPDEV